MIKEKNIYINELKNTDKHEADDLLVEFIDKFNILSLQEIPDKFRDNKNAIIAVLKNKLIANSSSWKSFAKNRFVFMDKTYSNCKYFNDCFKLAFKDQKWDFVLDLCSRDVVELNSENLCVVQNTKHDEKSMKLFFENNKELVLNNPQIFSVIINTDSSYAKHIPTSLQNDLKFIIPLVNNNPTIVKYIYPSHPLLDNDMIMLSAATIDPSIYFKASDRLKNSTNFVDEILQSNADAVVILSSRYSELPLAIQNNKILKPIIDRKKAENEELNKQEAQKKASSKQISKEELKKIVEKTIDDYTYIGKTHYACDPKIMLFLIKIDYRTYTQAHPTIKNTHNFIKLAVKADYRVAAYLPEAVRNNEELMLSLICANFKAAEYIGEKLSHKKSFLKKVDEIKKILNEKLPQDFSENE